MRFNLIGPGRVGLALAHALIHRAQYTLCGLYHPKLASAQKTVDTLSTGTPINKLKDLPEADITFITAKDGDLETLVQQLAGTAHLKQGSLVAHMSGILGSNILTPLKSQGVQIGSLHPLKAFCQKDTPEENAFDDIDCAVEGDKTAVTALTTLGKSLGAHVFTIYPEHKTTYHAAAIMASNYLVTLASVATELFNASGIEKKKAHTLCTHLMQTSLNNLKKTDSAKCALTGPLMRGDIATIEKHLSALQSETIKTLYQTAGLATLSLVDLESECLKKIKEFFKYVPPVPE